MKKEYGEEEAGEGRRRRRKKEVEGSRRGCGSGK